MATGALLDDSERVSKTSACAHLADSEPSGPGLQHAIASGHEQYSGWFSQSPSIMQSQYGRNPVGSHSIFPLYGLVPEHDHSSELSWYPRPFNLTSLRSASQATNAMA